MGSIDATPPSVGPWNASDHESDKDRKRQRTNVACAPCRRRKIRCDGESPSCSNCGRLGKLCVYERVSEQENLIAREKKRALRLKRAQQTSKAARVKHPSGLGRHASNAVMGGHAGHQPHLRWDGNSDFASSLASSLVNCMHAANGPFASQASASGSELPHPSNFSDRRQMHSTSRHQDLPTSETYMDGHLSQPSQLWPSSSSASAVYPGDALAPYGRLGDSRNDVESLTIAPSSVGLGDDLPPWARTTFANHNITPWKSLAPTDSARLAEYDPYSAPASDASGGFSTGSHSAGSSVPAPDGLDPSHLLCGGLLDPDSAPFVSGPSHRGLSGLNAGERPAIDGEQRQGYWTASAQPSLSYQANPRSMGSPSVPTQVPTQSWLPNLSHHQQHHQVHQAPDHLVLIPNHRYAQRSTAESQNYVSEGRKLAQTEADPPVEHNL